MRVRLVIFAWALLGSAACQREAPPIEGRFEETFEGDALAGHWHDTGGRYRVVDGRLRARGAYNHPLWLRQRLPESVRIEVDAWADTAEGDIKVELFGDGHSFDPDKGSYMSSGYVAVLGGWKNTISALARLDEHGGDRKERRQPRVEAGRKYHFTFERTPERLRWLVDGEEFLVYEDSLPLKGKNHGFFAFNNWSAAVAFDNLVIEPL